MRPANTNSNDDEELALISNNGSATSPRSRPRSPWTMDKSSGLGDSARQRGVIAAGINQGEGSDSVSYNPTPGLDHGWF